MSFQLLIATMNQTDYSLLDRVNLCADAVVINQCGRNARHEFKKGQYSVLWVDTSERGLSKSRNMAMKNASADYCLIVDDDEVIRPSAPQDIKEAFEKHKDAAFLRFEVEGIERKYKSYTKKEDRINYVSAWHISSVQLAFRREVIIKNNIKFNELIGAGTEFLCGEENAFVYEMLRNGLLGYCIPKVIIDLHLGNSCWFRGYNRQYFIAKGAAITAISKKCAIVFILLYCLKHREMYTKIGFFEGVFLMLKGHKAYLKKESSL